MIQYSTMINVNELRKGTTFRLEGQPYQVVDYKHTKLGRGTANIRVKIRNLATGSVVEKNFVSGARVEELNTETRELQYLYRDSQAAYFMDQHSFEQFSLAVAVLGSAVDYLKEGSVVKILFAEDQPLSVQLPVAMVFTVNQAPPGVKGDSANAAYKQVVLDNGLTVKVPLFVKQGDRVKIDTRTGAYLERIK